KIKTVFQMIAIILLLGAGPEQSPAVMTGYVLLYISAVLTLWSMFQYLKVAWPDLYSGMKNE
ncbi:MAG: CDP-diacylglycerol--glycerol-3-phosphate 3-phosphatidyltransferase, partial [Gammaproteobacteria bacterium]|nr:CDP-diacylglycerol--glycerol-3-phosphate 3-phosphatidyltransferase [Gammaproteobacteria bacterium]